MTTINSPHAATPTEAAPLQNGIVCRSQSNLYDVALLQSESEQHWLCTLRGKLRREQQRLTNLLAVGDEVVFRDLGNDQGVIEAIIPRRSKLSRDNNQKKDTEQILAANIDYSVIIMACHAPDYNPRRLDLHLSAAFAGGLAPIIVLSKVDLPQAETAKQDIDRYRLLGYPVIATSTATGEGLEELAGILQHKRSVFVGSSGVGKSSLLNALDPGLNLRTNELRERFSKGRHTTTAAELLRLANGAWVIDTPGVRTFSLWDREDQTVEQQYGEFEEYAGSCRYADCSHIHEPGCAVLTALHEGLIDEERYNAYAKLLLRQQKRRKAGVKQYR